MKSNPIIQVVAGALYKFTLQLEHTKSKECAVREETEECKVVVWEKKWLDFREVQWDQTEMVHTSTVRGYAKVPILL